MVADIKPLGLGVNIQPNAVCEFYELGFGPESLDMIGLQTPADEVDIFDKRVRDRAGCVTR